MPLVRQEEKAVSAMVGAPTGLDLWHYRLSHADNRAVQRLADDKIVDGIDLTRKP